jgi:hypothetical protein
MARKAGDEASHRAGAPAISIGIAVLAGKGHGTGARAASRHAGLIIAKAYGSDAASLRSHLGKCPRDVVSA